MTPALGAWCQSSEVSFLEELADADSQETELESTSCSLLSFGSFGISHTGAELCCFISFETSLSHGIVAHAHLERGPPSLKA